MTQTTKKTRVKAKVDKTDDVGIQTTVSESSLQGKQEAADISLTDTSSLEAPQEKIPGGLKDLSEGFMETNQVIVNDLVLHGDPTLVLPFADIHKNLMQVPYNPIPTKTHTQYEYYKDQDCSFQTLERFGEQGWQLRSTFVWTDKLDGRQVVHYIFMREKHSA